MNSPDLTSTDTNTQRKYAFAGLSLALILFVIDQITKYLVRGYVLDNGGSVEITGFFNLSYVWNEGVSFGMMQSQTHWEIWGLIAIAAAITALFAVILWRADRLITAMGCGTIIGGSIGNIVDRIQFGAVYDFLDFHAYGYHWPSFNVADSCVLIGIAIIAYDSLFLTPKSEQKS